MRLRVLDLDFNDETSSIVFEVDRRPFEESYHTAKFHLGQSFERAIVHKHDRLFRRQEEEEASSSSSDGVATSTAPPGTYRTTVPLTFTNTNASFPQTEDIPIDIGCKNCSSTGELILTAVDFVLNNLPTDDDDLVKSGSIQFDLNGFDLSIGLRAAPSISFNAPLPIFRTPRLGFINVSVSLYPLKTMT